MDDSEFDKALVGAALATAGETGWRGVTVARAAERAGLDLGRARARFPGKLAVLLRLGVIADQSALAGVGTAGPVRDRLFDMIMQRLDVFQTHREGMQALFRALPADPALALLLLSATRRSMAWLLDAAGVSTAGLPGALRVRGLTVVWLAAVRAWARDDSADLAATMRTVDDALQRAERAAGWAAPWLGDGGARNDDMSTEPTMSAPAEDLPPLPAAPLDTRPEPPPPPPPPIV